MNQSASKSDNDGESCASLDRVKVFITVDTEHSIGGAFKDAGYSPVGNEKRIFGKVGKKFFGIPLIMDIGDQYGVRMTFFVEVFNRRFFGEVETRHVVECIRKRGHDVQLHIHPNYLNFESGKLNYSGYSDFIGDYSFERQVEMISEARQYLLDYGIDDVVAFRAGCYGANAATLAALAKNEFLIDSSYNRAFLTGPCLMPDWGINDMILMQGVFEFPVTTFLEKTGMRAGRHMPLDINGVSFEEMRRFLNEARAGRGPQHVTIVLHSFSFVRALDVQYGRMKPRHHIIRRFERLCCFLAEHSKDFEVMAFGELSREQLQNMIGMENHAFPKMPAYLSMLRFVGQLWDRVG